MDTNVLYYGDNLEILRKYIPDNSVDLIYLDPPFNSKKSYNILFKENDTQWSPAQIKAFEDTWRWDNQAEATYQEIITKAPIKLAKLISAMRDGIGANDVMAYLVMMAIRLNELHRVLKPTGSLYLHCDPTASHYLKLLLDQIFGATKFRNEIVWNYGARGTVRKKGFPRRHHTLFYYTKSDSFVFNPVYRPYKDPNLRRYNKVDEQGRRYALIKRIRSATGEVYYGRTYPKQEGAPMTDVWDIPLPAATSKEWLGYETQKPLALLETIIKASSNEGDIVLDPFCGCGTALVAAHKLNRKWIGIDITHLAIAVMKRRLQDHFPGIQIKVIGEPVDFPSAKQLAKQNHYQFQWWALSLIGARPLGEKKKGADKGIDGVIPFPDDGGAKLKRVVVQVKSGHVSIKDIRELKAVVGNDPMGILLTLEPPTQPMKTEAAEAGFYKSPVWQKQFPRLQILTIEEILAGKKPILPPSMPYPKAEPIPKGEQPQLI